MSEISTNNCGCGGIGTGQDIWIWVIIAIVIICLLCNDGFGGIGGGCCR